MNLSEYVQAMPKVDLHVSLEGAVRKRTLKILAEMNEIPDHIKHFNDWLNLIDKPDFKRLHDIVKTVGGWILEVEDLARVVYDAGVALHHQNVKYAEISVNPVIWSALNLSADDFLSGINDGRERAERGWGIKIAWVFTIPRDEPRRADEMARWVSSVSAKKGGVVALGLSGRESVQPIGQFERPFRAIEKKGIPRVARAGDQQGADGVKRTLDALLPTRLYDAWGTAETPELLKTIADQRIGVGVNLTRAVKSGWIERVEDYPLRTLYDADIPVFLGSDMPTYLGSTLNDEYAMVVEKLGFGIDELEQIALNAVRQSCLSDDAKAAMETDFKAQYEQLRSEFETTA